MVSLIETPDILPNNMKKLRAMRGKTTNEIGKALSLNNSYISVVENWKSSISSITAFKLMQYLKVNFEQFFDMKQTMMLPYTKEIYENHKICLELQKIYIDKNDVKHMVDIEKILEAELIARGINGKIDTFNLIDKASVNEELYEVKYDVKLLTQIQTEKEFSINLLSDIDYNLFIKLNDMGFARKKCISLSDINEEYFQINEKGKIKSVECEVSYEAMSNLDIIQEYLQLSAEDIQIALGITEKTYNNILIGTQKLPLKVMWRMVALFKVPLELIINVPLYMETFND